MRVTGLAAATVTLLCLGACGGEAPAPAVAGEPAAMVPSPGQRRPGELALLDEDACSSRRRLAGARVEVARVEHLPACKADADCVLADPSTGCQGLCPVATNRIGAILIARAVHEVDGSYCHGYHDDGCPVAVVRCLRTLPVCVEEECVAIREPLCRLSCRDRGR
jgi:hypothetical protein